MKIIDLIVDCLKENEIPYDEAPNSVEVKGGYLTTDCAPQVWVWLDGECNPTNWLIDEVIEIIDFSDPNAVVQQIVSPVKDLGRMFDILRTRKKSGPPYEDHERAEWKRFRKSIQRYKAQTY